MTMSQKSDFASLVLRFVLSLVPFAIFGLLYFSMKFFPSYEYNDIDIRGLYESEKSIFGFIPCEYFMSYHNSILDVIAGVSYFCWVPLPIAFAIILFCQKKYSWCVRFTTCFLLCNIIGMSIYYIHPAAPPWFAINYGFEPLFDVPGNVGGLARFDELVGFPLFHSIYSGNSNIYAAIPSLHAAYMLIATIYAVLSHQKRTLIIVFSLVTVGIWFTAVYSSHHYVIDVALGILTAIISVIVYEQLLMRISPFAKFINKYATVVADRA